MSRPPSIEYSMLWDQRIQVSLICKAKTKYEEARCFKPEITLSNLSYYYNLNYIAYENFKEQYDYGMAHPKPIYPPFTGPTFYLRCLKNRLCICSYYLIVICLIIDKNKNLKTKEFVTEVRDLIDKLELYEILKISKYLTNIIQLIDS